MESNTIYPLGFSNGDLVVFIDMDDGSKKNGVVVDWPSCYRLQLGSVAVMFKGGLFWLTADVLELA